MKRTKAKDYENIKNDKSTYKKLNLRLEYK